MRLPERVCAGPVGARQRQERRVLHRDLGLGVVHARAQWGLLARIAGAPGGSEPGSGHPGLLITDLRLADLALAAYSEAATIETDDVHALLVEEDGVLLVGLRGTNPAKWVDLWRDAASIVLRRDPILGPTPDSFLTDAEQLVWRLAPRIRSRPWAIGAHSKGAAEAQAAAAIATFMGWPPVRLAAFAPPPMGRLGGWLDGVPSGAYRHGEDPITDDEFGRGRPTPLIPLAWTGPKPLDPLDYHSMEGYRAALAA